MNIGDKVRLVHGKEEGIVYRFLPGNIVEIEIEDGFRIPALRNEVVLVSPIEKERFKSESSEKSAGVAAQSRGRSPFALKGIYMAFVPVNDREMTVHVINNSDWTLPFVAFQDLESKQTGLATGILDPRTTKKITEVLIKDFEKWPTFEIQILYFKEGSGAPKAPFQKRLKCRAQSFYKRKQSAPVLNKEAYVYQLDEEGEALPAAATVGINAASIRESMLSPQSQPQESRGVKAQSVVDLHLDKISTNPEAFSNSEKLTHQLTTFEAHLEQAIASGLDEVTFIHGAGSGVLRSEIHRRLSKHPNVQFFKDAQKEKFGYGATYVKIK